MTYILGKDDITAEVLISSLDAFAKLAAALPDEVALIRQVTFEHLASGPPAHSQNVWAHLGEHFSTLIPAVFDDPRLSGLRESFPTTGERLLSAGKEDVPPAAVVGWAAGAIAIVVISVAAYCTVGPWPPKGESAPAHCT